MYRNIYAMCKMGQKKLGVEKGPKVFKDYLNLVDGHHMDIKKIDDYKKLYNLNLNLLNRFIKPVNIGGDHSISFATLSSSLIAFNGKIKTIWVDAHMDCNTFESSPSGNLHGMPLSQAFSKLPDIFNFHGNTKYYLSPESMILYLGIRDIDIFEREFLEKYNIHYISCDEINNFDKRTIKKIDQFIDNYPIHFSFDVDSLDPSFIESTGTPVDKGLNPYKFLNMVNQTNMKKNIVNMDLVEFNPDLQSNPYKLFRELEIIKSIYFNFI